VHTSAAPVEVTHARDPHLEIAPKVSLESADVAMNPDLEPTIRSSEAAPTIVTPDPHLVTDPSDLVSSFPTRFGVANPEDVPVGVPARSAPLYADANGAPEPSALDPADVELETIEPGTEPAAAPAAKPAWAEPSSQPFEQTAGKSAWVAEEAPLEDHESG